MPVYLTHLDWPDIVDILLQTVVAYYLYLWFKGTKAQRALIGLVVLAVLYPLARHWGLFLTTWAFQLLWQVLVILLIILFQNEIRQVLERVVPQRFLGRRLDPEAWPALKVVAAVARQAAKRGWGTIVVIKRRDSLSGLAGEGLAVEARLSPELLLSVFNPTSPTHDGAAVVEEDVLSRVGVILPLSKRDDLPSEYGTRHRAGLGISEACDAVAVIVSEERRVISLAVGGGMKPVLQPERLEEELAAVMSPVKAASRPTLLRLVRAGLANWPIKLGALVLVSLTWLTLAGQQNYEVNLKAPVIYYAQEPGLTVGELSDKEVTLRLSGPRRLASVIKPDEVRVLVNLAGQRAGSHSLTLDRQAIRVPLDLELTGVSPKVVNVILKPEPKK